MIIVNQNKEKIINFENIKAIRINWDSDYETSEEFWIISVDGEDMAHYKTKKRAKEVLQEIVNTYKKIGIEFETFNGGTKQQLPIYEMPED